MTRRADDGLLSEPRTGDPAVARGPLPAPNGTSRRGAAPTGGTAAASGVVTAVLLATAPADDGGCAATLRWEDGTVLGRLLAQLADVGFATAIVLTRPAWEPAVRRAVERAPLLVDVRPSPSVPADLTAVADLARAAEGGLMVALADIVTHREALAGLLADPRIGTGILTAASRRRRAFRIRGSRGRVVSAASPYHSVRRATTMFLGVLKVSPADVPALAAAAERLAVLTEGPLPPGWEEMIGRRAARWRTTLAHRAEHDDEDDDDHHPRGRDDASEIDQPLAGPGTATADDDDDGSHDDEDDGAGDAPGVPEALPPEAEAELAHRVAVLREDVPSLLVVGLVRSGTHVGMGHLRRLFWARPLSQPRIEQAAERITHYDEDRVLLDSAVKGVDGFFTTYLVSPYSKYIARWAAHRGLTPNQITTVSLLIGIVAAAAFATGERAGLVAGAVLLQVAFTADCVDGQLARYTRRFSKLGAWLDSIFDRTKEYVVFAGLAIGASRMGDPVWLLAASALTLQTVRHTFDFSWASTQHERIGAAEHNPIEIPSDWPGAPVPGSPEALRKDAARTAAAATVAKAEAAPAAGDGPPASIGERLRRAPRRVLRLWSRFDGLTAVRWMKRMVAFPIGERFAVISLTAALFTPRVTFIAVLAWGGLAAAYTFTGRVLRSV